MIKDRESPFKVGDKVVYIREESIGSHECYACGSEVEEYEDVVTEHEVIGITASYTFGGGVQYFYSLDGSEYGNQVGESYLSKP